MMKPTWLLAIALLAWPTGAWAQGAPAPVTVQGCPKPGVEARCLMLSDGGVTYDITAAKPQPKPGVAIHLQGTPVREGISICQQGIILKDITWQETGQSCAK
jgi:hypothetical protein